MSEVKNQIKILHIITSLSMAGAEMMLYKLLSGIDKKRFDPTVITLVEGPMAEKIRELGFPVWSLDMKNGRPDMKGLWKLVRLVKQIKPDIIQGWMYHANLTAQFANMFVFPKVPVLWNIRHSFNNLRDEKKSTAMVIRLGAILSRLPVKINYCGSESLDQHQNIGYCPQKTVFIPNGFDTQSLLPSEESRIKIRNELGLKKSTRIIGIIGRYSPMKDHANFLKAAAFLAKKKADVQFIMAGRNVDSQNDELTSLIKELGLEERVHLLGLRGDIPDLLPALDLHCTASAYGESFPNVIGEAMSCGVPCVATDVGDSRRIIGDAGRIVPPRSPSILADALLELLQMPEEKKRELGQKARARIVDLFSIDNIILDYNSLYEEVLSRKN